MKPLFQIKPSQRLRRELYSRSCHGSIPAGSSAIVFAPHQDDETLGCGGTVRMKRQAGTPVKLVFMTDGATSHSRFVPSAELTRMRNAEALEAARVLDVPADDVEFLAYPDSRLAEHHASAVRRVTEILRACKPHEVFVPYEHDETPDHEATHRVVAEAARESGLTVHLLEYPVWFWNQWPWVSFRVLPNRETARALVRMARHRFGRTALREFRCRVPVQEHLAAKREALAKHRTQTTEVIPGVGWPVLSDVSDGDFLDCFFQEYEVFRCSEVAASHSR